MPAGDPAGYLPSVKKSRAAVKRAGKKPYTIRAKRRGGIKPVPVRPGSSKAPIGMSPAMLRDKLARRKARPTIGPTGGVQAPSTTRKFYKTRKR